MKYLLLILFALTDIHVSFAQDDSPRWVRKPLALSEEVSESSGLFVTEEGIWTFNDSGGKSEIYLLDTSSGQVQRRVKIQQILNKDWEAAMIGNGQLYIADAGNNSGKRTDLKVYSCGIPQKGDSLISVLSEWRFRWPDELYGSPEDKQHDRDCEAMVLMNDTIFLLSKSWKTLSVKLASLSKSPVQIASVVDSFFTGFVATDAAFRAESLEKGTLLLIGYENKIPGDVWLWIFEGKPGSQIFRGSVKSMKLGNALYLGQIEGICFTEPSQVVLSAEQFGLQKTALLHFLQLPK